MRESRPAVHLNLPAVRRPVPIPAANSWQQQLPKSIFSGDRWRSCGWSAAAAVGARRDQQTVIIYFVNFTEIGTRSLSGKSKKLNNKTDANHTLN